eukprot:Phypoly_transcript_09160.p1 GENE.Phypoly_transcript_09160~~Phypoly_transcript_09160.p1  ORF type:complete len:380 (+),score=68.30 Phypoly_transcript_09160:130-1140(+)
MTRAEFDKECKICQRPFTVFRWRPGATARYKKTEVCQTCAKVKNVCQTCLLDLEFGLPVQVRDTATPNNDPIPLSEANREYFQDLAERKIASGQLPHARFEPTAMIQKLARSAPYYKRNRAHVCSFFVKGECKRGAECPYRHEMPEDGELSAQNIKDRYYGVNDPVANKMLRRAEEFSKLTPPEDQDITTLYIGNLDPTKVTEEDVKSAFYSFGELRSLKVVPHQNCAFVTYTTRAAAEAAAEKLYNRLFVNGNFLRLSWGKPPSMQSYGQEGAPAPDNYFSLPPPVSATPYVPTTPQPLNFFFPNPPPLASAPPPKPFYPSMDPNIFGAPHAKPQ